jgi:hypothetical protein
MDGAVGCCQMRFDVLCSAKDERQALYEAVVSLVRARL